MAIVVDPGLLHYMASHRGSCTFVLRDAPAEDAVRGLQSARQAVGTIRHPDEPQGPLASSISAVEPTADGARFTIEIADADAYDGLLERVLQAVIDGIARAAVESGLLTFPPLDPIGGSAIGLPLPDPHQELWASCSGSRRSAGYLLPHDTESLLRHFELLPGVLLSYTATPPDDMPFGAVYLVTGGRTFFVCIRDAGTAHVEMTVETDNAKVEAVVLELRSTPLPPGIEVRLDRR